MVFAALPAVPRTVNPHVTDNASWGLDYLTGEFTSSMDPSEEASIGRSDDRADSAVTGYCG